MSKAKMVDCPRGCGWAYGSPDLDEDGMPYTCFYCGNQGQVDAATVEADDAIAAAYEAAFPARAPQQIVDFDNIPDIEF